MELTCGKEFPRWCEQWSVKEVCCHLDKDYISKKVLTSAQGLFFLHGKWMKLLTELVSWYIYLRLGGSSAHRKEDKRGNAREFLYFLLPMKTTRSKTRWLGYALVESLLLTSRHFRLLQVTQFTVVPMLALNHFWRLKTQKQQHKWSWLLVYVRVKRVYTNFLAIFRINCWEAFS